MGNEAYFDAIREGNVERLERLLNGTPELLHATTRPSHAPEKQSDCTGLHAAVYAGQPEVARVLVDAGIDLEARTREGRTALHDSIEFGAGEITSLLLERGADVDICTAAILGRRDRLHELLSDDPRLVNDRSTQLSPLGWASFGNQVETARELVHRGANMDDGELLCAASVGHVEVGRLLIENGAKPDEIDEDAGGNALHAAAAMRYTEDSTRFIELLLDLGADVDVRTRDGRSALQIAETRARRQEEALARGEEVWKKNFAGVAELLRQRGAKEA